VVTHMGRGLLYPFQGRMAQRITILRLFPSYAYNYSDQILCGYTYMERAVFMCILYKCVARFVQGLSDGGISVYTPKSVYLKKLCGCSSPVTQDRFDMIYVHVFDINICFEIAMTS